MINQDSAMSYCSAAISCMCVYSNEHVHKITRNRFNDLQSDPEELCLLAYSLRQLMYCSCMQVQEKIAYLVQTGQILALY